MDHSKQLWIIHKIMGSACKGKREKQKLSCPSQVGRRSSTPLAIAELFLLSEVFISSPCCSLIHVSTCKPIANEIKNGFVQNLWSDYCYWVKAVESKICGGCRRQELVVKLKQSLLVWGSHVTLTLSFVSSISLNQLRAAAPSFLQWAETSWTTCINTT